MTGASDTGGDDATGGPGAGRPSVSRGRVLVADDEEAVRHFVSRALEHAGFRVDAVADGLEAVEALAAGRDYDLLVTDIVMPGLDGIELSLRAARDHPDLPIILMTGFAAQKQRAYGLESLIHKVLTKPFTLQQLVDAAKAAVADRPGD
ncbi:MAG: response regulator [Azospirillaceae bacterium]